MKKIYLYVILILFEIAVGLAYGFALRNIISIEACLIIAFFVPFILMLIFSKKSQEKIWAKFLKILVLALFLALLSFIAFRLANDTGGKLIGEYEVVVEAVYGRGGGTAEFTSPYGTTESVELHDYRLTYADGDDYVDVGDTIKVREYKGVFGVSYYVFVEETH